MFLQEGPRWSMLIRMHILFDIVEQKLTRFISVLLKMPVLRCLHRLCATPTHTPTSCASCDCTTHPRRSAGRTFSHGSQRVCQVLETRTTTRESVYSTQRRHAKAVPSSKLARISRPYSASPPTGRLGDVAHDVRHPMLQCMCAAYCCSL